MGLAKKKIAPVVSIDDVLAGASTPAKEAKSKSTTPVLTVSKEVKELVARIREQKEEFTSLKGMIEADEAELRELIAPLRGKLCQKGYVSTVRVPSTDDKSVSVTWSKSYSKCELDNREAIVEIVGEEEYDDLFTAEKEITVKGDIDDKTLRELIDAVGPMRFAEFFDVKRWIKPTERYTEGFFSSFNEEQREALAGMVQQYKASIKTK